MSKQAIIKEMRVLPTIDANTEINRRVNFIKQQLETSGCKSLVLGISGGLAFLGLMYGPQAAFFTELFSTEVRYSGASLGYQIGAIVGGAFAPTIATILWIEYDIVWVSVYIAGASLLSLIAVKMLTETYQSSLSDVD
jgi:MFS family permease